MNELTIFKALPFTKAEQKNFAFGIICQIVEGYAEPLATDLRLKAMEETIKAIRENTEVKQITIEEAQKYGKSFREEGVDVEVKTRTTKNYEGLDSVLDSLYSDLEHLKGQIKAREAMVDTGVNPETGETFSPPATSRTTYLTYKFK